MKEDKCSFCGKSENEVAYLEPSPILWSVKACPDCLPPHAHKLAGRIAERSQPLGEDFEKILNENSDHLYEE